MASAEMDRNRWEDEMGKRSEARCTEWSGRIVAPWILAALASACLIPAHAAADSTDSDRDAAGRQAPRRHGESNLDARVRLLSKALDLDATQQSELRKLLEGQRERVMQVWDDPALPAVYRISATHAISDNTADQIRALLNDDQKKKYNPPRQPHEAASGSDRPSVEALMNALKPK